MRRIFLSAVAILCAMCYSYAQTIAPAAFNTAGGSYDNPGSSFRFEWSFGELLLISSLAPADSSIFLTQGVLQPCTDSKSSSVSTVFQNGDYRLFPNPTAGKFELNFFIRESGEMNLRLVDATGRVLEKRTYAYNGCCSIQLFDLTAYPAGLYYVIAELRNEIVRYSGLKVMKLGK